MLTFVLLIAASYLVGSIPLSYLIARWTKGIDLRTSGTRQVGTGNFFRMTSSWKLSVPVALWDGCKGMLLLWLGRNLGLSIAMQLVLGLAVVAGHNWSLFLKFSGGRGIGTILGIIIILPLLNNINPWVSLSFLLIGITCLVFFRRTPVPVLIASVSLPVTAWITGEPVSIILGYLGLLCIIIVKRLTAEQKVESLGVPRRELLLNRLLFDRDIRDRNAWVYRPPIEGHSKPRPNRKDAANGKAEQDERQKHE